MPDIAEQGAVTRHVRCDVNSPALRGAARPGPGPPEHLVSRSLADREDESVCDGPHQFPVPVVTLVCLVGGGGFGGAHGMPFSTGRHLTPSASVNVRRMIQLR